jgi:hypothetical protein
MTDRSLFAADLPDAGEPSQRTVAPEVFREWIAPHVASLRDLTIAIDATSGRHGGLPAAESRAMSDRREEQNYRRCSDWEQPITDTHAFGALTLQAATDNVRGIAELFDSSRPPLYAYLTLARAALESTVVSAWLSEPGIACLERIKRGLCEMLYSANEINELGLDPGGLERVEFWKGVGAGFGWTIDNSRTKPIVDSTRRPRVSDGIVQLTGVNSDVANSLYSRLSAVDHVTWSGLISAMDLSGAQRDDRTGTATVPISVDGGKVAAYTRYVVKALHAAARTRFTFMGWLDDSWLATAANAEALEERLLKTAVASLPATWGPAE